MKSMKVWVCHAAALALLVCGVAMPAAAGDGKVYTLAVIPSAPPVTMHTRWMPYVERLSRMTGLTFQLKMFDRMADFEREIWAGTPDLIFASPIQTVVAHMSSRYAPLVRAKKLVSIGLYVRADSPIRTIDDLSGKRIAFVGNKNLCSVFVRDLLATNRKQLAFASDYTGSTRNVIINVLRDKSDAGAVFRPELANETVETRQQLREILATHEIAPHPLSAHPRVPQAVQEAIKKATFTIAATRDGAEMLKTIMLADPVAADYDHDYRAMERIDIKGLTNWGE